MKVRWQHIEVLRLEPSTRTARWSTHSLTQQASETVCEKYEGPSRVTWECCVPANVIVTQNLELIPCKFLNSGGISCPRWPHSGLNSGAGCVYRRWQQGLLLATYAAAALATASMVRPPSDASSAAAAHAMWQYCGKHGSPAFAAVARATTASTRRRCNDDPLPASPRCPLNGDVEVGALLPCKRLAKAQPSSEDASSSVEAACAARQYRCRYGSTARAAIVRATMCLPPPMPIRGTR